MNSEATLDNDDDDFIISIIYYYLKMHKDISNVSDLFKKGRLTVYARHSIFYIKTDRLIVVWHFQSFPGI